MGALAAARQPAAMTVATVRPDLDEPLDVHRDVLAQVALDLALVRDDLPDTPQLVLGEVLDAAVHVHLRLAQDVVRAGAADPVDVRQTDLDPLVLRKIYTGDSCHGV